MGGIRFFNNETGGDIRLKGSGRGVTRGTLESRVPLVTPRPWGHKRHSGLRVPLVTPIIKCFARHYAICVYC